MVQKQILKEQDRCIYQIQEDIFNFYIVIPSTYNVNLTLTLISNINSNKLFGINKYSNKVVVVPILDDKILMGIMQNQINYFEWLEKYFSSLINLAYKILVYNNIKVDSMVYFSSEKEYINFQNWFIARHQDRVLGFDMFNYNSITVNNTNTLLEKNNINNSINVKTDNDESIESSKIEKTDNRDIPISSDDINNISKNEEASSINTKEPGFVSYVLLGVLVAVLSLVFLYYIL